MLQTNGKTWLIYGANGYTGELIAREAARRGWTPVLAGRNAAAVERLGRELNLPARVFDLEDPAQIAAALMDANAGGVLHCAGPFRHTSAPMLQACLRAKAHYLDITGEIDVFEAIACQDSEARSAGIVLMPGVGFDVVPTDCLAARLAEALPGAVDLQLAFASNGGISRGTLKTGIENLPNRGAIRRDGRIVRVPMAHEVKEIEFSRGRRWAMTIPWGDVSTAFRTTGIPNVRVYLGLSRRVIRLLRRAAPLMPVTGWPAFKWLARWWVERAVTGPSEETRTTARVGLWGQVQDPAGRVVTGTLETPEGYGLTVTAALECIDRVRGGPIGPGSWTPAGAFGPGLVSALPGVSDFKLVESRSGNG